MCTIKTDSNNIRQIKPIYFHFFIFYIVYSFLLRNNSQIKFTNNIHISVIKSLILLN